MKSFRILAIVLICAGFSLLAPRNALADPPAAGPAPASSLPSSPAPACHPVVKVFGETVCKESAKLQPMDASELPGGPSTRQDMMLQQGKMNNMAMIKAIVWQKALIHKFGAAALAPTDQEIDAYRMAFNDSMKTSFEADRKTADLVNDLLTKNNYMPDNEKKLQRLFKETQLSLKLYGERQQHTETMPKEYQFVVDSAERQVARNMLTSWKSDKALYDAYGGHLLVTDTGVAPLDAYTAFLKYIREDGKLEIVDPAYTDFLKETESFISARHPEVGGHSEIVKKYFSSPTWQFTLGNNDDRFSNLKAQLEKIPTLGPKQGVDVPESELVGKQSKPASPIVMPIQPGTGKTP